jgi:hypothetical protein
MTNNIEATIVKKLPDLRVAIPLDDVEVSPRRKDVGILKLPVVW